MAEKNLCRVFQYPFKEFHLFQVQIQHCPNSLNHLPIIHIWFMPILMTIAFTDLDDETPSNTCKLRSPECVTPSHLMHCLRPIAGHHVIRSRVGTSNWQWYLWPQTNIVVSFYENDDHDILVIIALDNFHFDLLYCIITNLYYKQLFVW